MLSAKGMPGHFRPQAALALTAHTLSAWVEHTWVSWGLENQASQIELYVHFFFNFKSLVMITTLAIMGPLGSVTSQG